MKKWLSRGIVLAMVVAMMIPAPVLAKSSKSSGKLVKSVTVYETQAGGTSWVPSYKYSFKYDKKKNPVSETVASLTTYLGIPVSGYAETFTTKYKYKGKNPKSSTTYDSAGFVSGKQSYKKGNVVSWSNSSKYSYKQKDPKTDAWYDWANFDAGVGHASYFKNGLMKTEDATYSGLDSDGDSYAYTENSVYSWVQKKGVPSLLYRTTVRNGVSEWGYKYDGTPSTGYAIYNSKGLMIEAGSVVDGKNRPYVSVQYTMKKGRVDTAAIYSIDKDGKPTPSRMLKFKYTKTKVSKTRYFNDINDMLYYNGSEIADLDD